MKYVLPLSICFTICFVFSCRKDDSKADDNRSLLIGNYWQYQYVSRSTTTFNSDGSVRSVDTFSYSPAGASFNRITFSNDGKVYSVEDGFGPGLSGSRFVDTVPYKVTDNTIILYFPAGTNDHYSPSYNYPAYEDTLAIQFLSGDSFSFTRRYHYKHLADSTELKTCAIQLKKQ